MSRVLLPSTAPAGLVLLLITPWVQAASVDGPPPPLAQAWTLSTWTLLPLALLAGGYLLALLRLRAAQAPPMRRVCAFAAAMLTLVLVLVWPLDAYAGYLASAHVAQHMALLALAPPLLLAARPCGIISAALPPRLAQVARRLIRPLDAATSALAAATLAHVATMWLWHMPGAIAASLASETVHRGMLASVLIAGLWFWSAVLRRLRTRDGGAAGACVALVTAMMFMGFLGALLTFSPRLLYPAYSDRALLAGVDALRDQQLAGLLMWVPGGLPYLVVGLMLIVALTREPGRDGGGRAA